MTDDSTARCPVTSSVQLAAAIKRKQNPIPPIVRLCPVCEEPLPAGMVRHPPCRGWNP